VASRTAIRALIELALGTPDWIMRLNEELAQEVLQRLSQRIKQVGVALIEKARVDPRLTGMATTMTLACSLGANLLIAHVGDSRAYLFRQGQLYRLTSDHTVAQALAKAGWIGLEDVASHPLRNRLTQVVGSTGDKALADLGTVQLMDGDQVLLCTDGLTDMVEEAAITQALTLEGTAAAVCRALVEMALEGGGRDNITVVLGRYRIPQ
jgi:protein phosphatase